MTIFEGKEEKNQMLTIAPHLRGFFASVFCPQGLFWERFSGSISAK
jgi:hypothetical protein